MSEKHAQALVFFVALAGFITALGMGTVLNRKTGGTVQVLIVTVFYMVVVVSLLTKEEWRDGQTAIGLFGILVITSAATSVGYLCSRAMFKVGSSKD